MEPNLQNFLNSPLGTTIAFVIMVFIARFFIVTVVAKSDLARITKRKFKGYIHNFSIILIFISIIFIWFSKLQSFALSLVAIAVAIAITMKEYTLNLLGGVYRTANHPFYLGDRIEIGDYRGDVISINLSSTTIMEVGPHQISHQYTGKSITIPNSLFLSKPVTNETYTRKYLLHIFKVPVALTHNLDKEEELLLQAANIECEPFINEAETYMTKLREKENIEMPPMVPRVTIHFKDEKAVNLVLRVPAPANSRGRLENAIIKRFLSSRRTL